MEQVYVMNHPLVSHKMSILRDKDTTTKEFRELIREIAMLVAFKATEDLETKEVTVETPLMQTICHQLKRQVVLVPILRAGLGMCDAMLDLFPDAKVGHIGMGRDHETLLPVTYYCNLPEDIGNQQVLLLDPMLATGGSAAAAIEYIKKQGAKRIKFLCIIAAPEGVELLKKEHPDVEIYIGALDEKLNENGYILPGLGDAGDRLFGTL